MTDLARDLAALLVAIEGRVRAVVREELQAEKGGGADSGFLEIDEAAKIVGVTSRTLANWARLGRIPGTKVGRKWKFRRQDLIGWMEQRTNGGRK